MPPNRIKTNSSRRAKLDAGAVQAGDNAIANALNFYYNSVLQSNPAIACESSNAAVKVY